LDSALKSLPIQNFPEVLVGYSHSDDAGVYLLTHDLAIAQTVDFFSPIVDDPYAFGQIAAANALSDIYAMGGQPRTALSIVGFPTQLLESKILTEIMRGGLAKLTEAGVALLGGHTVRDDEVKFGYAVTGTVNVKDIKQNNGARPGARVLLTKPLGTGLIATALKKGKADPGHVETSIAVMSRLNARAAEIAVAFNVQTMTDVTGFGVIGHALEVARASQVGIEINHRDLPVLGGALEYSRAGFCAGGLNNNRDFFADQITLNDTIPSEFRDLLFDPQTSGGLLIFVQRSDADRLTRALHDASVPAVEIGTTFELSGALIRVV
jgi:selenide, water dikinase